MILKSLKSLLKAKPVHYTNHSTLPNPYTCSAGNLTPAAVKERPKRPQRKYSHTGWLLTHKGI